MAGPRIPEPPGPRAWMARHGAVLSNLTLSVLLAFVGWFAVQWRELLWPRVADEPVDWQEMGMDPLQRMSFDVPFVLRHSLPAALRTFAGPVRSVEDVVLVYMDEKSTDRLGQPPGGPWSRAMHARLLNWLTQDGARAVIFDVVFDSETPQDAEFAAALAKNGQAFLGASINVNTEAPLTPEEAERFLAVGIATEQLSKRNRTLYSAARGWGLLTFRPIDSDYCVRRMFTGKPREGLDPWMAVTWRAAQALGTNLPEASRFERRWVNYYGPADRLESLSYYRAIVEDGGVPPGFFKNKIVFVGARGQLATGPKKLLDEFATPWSRFRARAYTPGAEIHATTLLNLMHRDWLGRVSLATEQWMVVLLGLALGGLRWLRPWHAITAAVLVAFAVFAGSCLLQWQGRLWWNWSVPVFLQIPLAMILAVGSRYYLEERRKRALRRAFEFYLSPQLATEIAERNFVLAPGGEKVVATMMFTDLEDFTTLSERLGDSAVLGHVLRDYFTRTTDEIFAEKGTVIKFIGDAVFAAWGAPLAQPDHAERAVRAAVRLARVVEMDLPSLRLDGTTQVIRARTRIGIHTGEALAGNLGSSRRFDYTLIGDAVNFASRLEGANKYLGTSILISDDTARLLGGKFLLRRLGAFSVKGKSQAIVVHELLGDEHTSAPPWLATFDDALAAWTTGDLERARKQFAAVDGSRAGGDGPSRFYLDRVPDTPPGPNWAGRIELDAK